MTYRKSAGLILTAIRTLAFLAHLASHSPLPPAPLPPPTTVVQVVIVTPPGAAR